ncbi:MAG: hypothetical protein MJE77_32085, partial [Proteobacteria bacterium]|nr:hypothetical protein [Pseudomonadota bacterium]
MAWLEQESTTAEQRELLKSELARLSPQYAEMRAQAARQRHANRVARVFAEQAGPSHPERILDSLLGLPAVPPQLRRATQVLQSLQPSPHMPGVFLIIHDGEQIAISAGQVRDLRKEIRRHFRRGKSRVQGVIKGGFDRRRFQKAINADHPIVGTIAGWLGGVEDPLDEMIRRENAARAHLRRLSKAIQKDDFTSAARHLALAAHTASYVHAAGVAFNEGHIRGAQAAVRALEITRDVSFAIAGTIAAVAAAPAVAAGLGTGAVGSSVAAVGGGAAVGAGLRAGANLLEQVSTGEPIDWSIVKSEAMEGAMDGAMDRIPGIGRLGRALRGGRNAKRARRAGKPRKKKPKKKKQNQHVKRLRRAARTGWRQLRLKTRQRIWTLAQAKKELPKVRVHRARLTLVVLGKRWKVKASAKGKSAMAGTGWVLKDAQGGRWLAAEDQRTKHSNVFKNTEERANEAAKALGDQGKSSPRELYKALQPRLRDVEKRPVPRLLEGVTLDIKESEPFSAVFKENSRETKADDQLVYGAVISPNDKKRTIKVDVPPNKYHARKIGGRKGAEHFTGPWNKVFAHATRPYPQCTPKVHPVNTIMTGKTRVP